MFEILTIVICIWLSIKFIGLALKLTWGLTKLFAFVLFLISLPALIGVLLFAGGVLLLVPIVLILIAIGVVGSCA